MSFSFRKHVVKALADVKQELGPEKFAWGMEFPINSGMTDLMKCIHVAGVGEIPVPITKEVLKNQSGSLYIVMQRIALCI